MCVLNSLITHALVYDVITEQAEEEQLAANAEDGTAAVVRYQAQLGMPKEEDLNSWSHHYSTDTVNDPVFRLVYCYLSIYLSLVLVLLSITCTTTVTDLLI
jgi:hypothetical protein